MTCSRKILLQSICMKSISASPIIKTLVEGDSATCSKVSQSWSVRDTLNLDIDKKKIDRKLPEAFGCWGRLTWNGDTGPPKGGGERAIQLSRLRQGPPTQLLGYTRGYHGSARLRPSSEAIRGAVCLPVEEAVGDHFCPTGRSSEGNCGQARNNWIRIRRIGCQGQP